MDQQKDNSIDVTELRRKAKGGCLLAAFELYRLGQNKNLTPDLSDDEVTSWYHFCWNYLQKSSGNNTKNGQPENKFYIQELILTNFRRFSKLKINFENDLTIIIGENGQGKTSILDALTKTFSWFVCNIIKEDNNGQTISKDTDIKIDSYDKFADIHANFHFGKGLNNIRVRLSRSVQGAANRRDSIVKPAKQVSDIWRVVNHDKMVNLPVFAFYSVGRSYSLIKSKVKINEKRTNRLDAYNDTLSGVGRFDHFAEWFIYLHKKVNTLNTTDVELLTKQIHDLEQSLNNGLISVEPLLKELQIKLQANKANAQKDLSNIVLSESDKMKIVSDLICKVVPSISRIWVDTSSGKDIIKVVNDNLESRIEQISDGQRVLLGLVADLARRMIMLNPLLKNPLTGIGIVLIDEIELHIHPKSQQLIICTLRAEFPNIQFIITTHSPLVLSTTEQRCIRLLNAINNSPEEFLQVPVIQTKGSETNDILEQVMGVFSTPRNIEESLWLSEFEEIMILQNGELSKEAENIYQKIVSHFGKHSSEHKKADNLVRLNRIKNKISKAKENKHSDL